jgi:hypothetical protein
MAILSTNEFIILSTNELMLRLCTMMTLFIIMVTCVCNMTRIAYILFRIAFRWLRITWTGVLAPRTWTLLEQYASVLARGLTAAAAA